MEIAVAPAGGKSYSVAVGRGILDSIALHTSGAARATIIHTRSVEQIAHFVAEEAVRAGAEVHRIVVPEGEAAKRLSIADGCWTRLAEIGSTRDDVVIGVGGGAVTDLAGYVASAWLRGIDVVQIPTTLLGMVDAAVGGKTGINTSAGKNLVGAFHHPRAVICDVNTLWSLPQVEVVSGMAEVIKAGFIADPSILDLLEGDPLATCDVEEDHIIELIARSIRVKADVVSVDPTEQGQREILNYGHTFAHAIERVEGYTWRHGEAVAVGMCFVAELARIAGRLDDATADRHASVLRSIGLPTTYSADRWDDLVEGMRVDKKNRGNSRRFIVLDGLAKPGVLDDPDEDLLLAAYKAVSA